MDHWISIKLPISMNFMDVQIMFAKFPSFVFADFHNGLLEGTSALSSSCVVLSVWSVGFERFVQSSTEINKVSSVFREERKCICTVCV